MRELFQKVGFKIRIKWYPNICGAVRRYWLYSLGLRAGKNTSLPAITISWPHQVSIGRNCNLEKGIIFKFDGIWKKGPSIIVGNEVFIGSCCEFNITSGIKIGNFANIASGCRFIDHDHGKSLATRIGAQPADERPIFVGNDVWLGCNVIVLKGVQIGDGAVVGAGAVVTKSILANEIWAGIPAKKIGERTLF